MLSGMREGDKEAPVFSEVHLLFAGLVEVEVSGDFPPGSRIVSEMGFDDGAVGVSGNSPRAYSIETQGGSIRVVARTCSFTPVLQVV